MKAIITENMPKANGHYSTCIEHNGLLYISGQLPFHPKTREMPMGIEEQSKQVLQNIELIVSEAGSAKEKILQMRIYIPDVKLWEEVNKVYSEFFGSHKPVRCVVPTRELHHGCLIEVEATAYL